MEYIKPHCCMCGELCNPIKRDDYARKNLYFCGSGMKGCVIKYWRQLHEQYLREKEEK